MNKADWDYVKEQLQSFWHPVELLIDGYKVSLKLERMDTYNNAIVMYINGWMKGEWSMSDCEERRRFFRPVTRYFYSKKQRKKLPKKYFPSAHKPYTYYMPTWKSFNRMKAHFIKHNESIELLKEQS